MKKSQPIVTLVMLTIFAAMVAISTTYPADARFMILVVGIPAIGLCLLQLGLDLYRGSSPAKPREQLAGGPLHVGRATLLPTGMPRDPVVRRELLIWGYFLAFIAGILLFGFRMAIPAFLIGFLRFEARARWRTALVLGIGASVILILLFEHVLRVSLHSGFVTDYLADLFGG
jgi:hypothetical protein